jgi:hypothetical protein
MSDLWGNAQGYESGVPDAGRTAFRGSAGRVAPNIARAGTVVGEQSRFPERCAETRL